MKSVLSLPEDIQSEIDLYIWLCNHMIIFLMSDSNEDERVSR